MAIENLSAAQPRPRAEVPAAPAARTDGKLPAGGEVDQPRPAAATPDAEQLQGYVESLNGVAQRLNRHVQFSIDEESGQTVIKIVDAERDTVIRQYPPDELLRLAEHIQTAQGLILHDEA